MAGEIKADQGSSIDGENDPASAVEVEEAVATTAIYGDDGEGAPATGVWGGMVKKRLPDAEVHSLSSAGRGGSSRPTLLTCRRKKSRSCAGRSRRSMP